MKPKEKEVELIKLNADTLAEAIKYIEKFDFCDRHKLLKSLCTYFGYEKL